MDIRMRIANVSGYFRSFNISEGIAYIMAAFPDGKWTVPDDVFGKVKVKKNKDTEYYFFTEIENGTDVLFDALDEVIKENMILLEKVELLKKYVEELKRTVSERSIEEVRRIRIIVPEEAVITADCTIGTEEEHPKPRGKNKAQKKAPSQGDTIEAAEIADKAENEAETEVSDAAMAMLSMEE